MPGGSIRRYFPVRRCFLTFDQARTGSKDTPHTPMPHPARSSKVLYNSRRPNLRAKKVDNNPLITPYFPVENFGNFRFPGLESPILELGDVSNCRTMKSYFQCGEHQFHLHDTHKNHQPTSTFVRFAGSQLPKKPSAHSWIPQTLFRTGNRRIRKA